MVATALVALLFSTVAATHSTVTGTLRAQRETIAAGLLIQGRLEQLRSGGWARITDATVLAQQVLGQASPQAIFLDDLRETITVSTYPPLTPAPAPLQIERRADGTTAIVSQPPGGFSLRELLAVRVDIHAGWRSRQNGRSRSRETSTVISVGGLLR